MQAVTDKLADHVGRRRGLRSAETLNLEVPRTWLSFGDRAFSVASRSARLEQSSQKCSLCPLNVLFKKILKNNFIPACLILI